MLGAADFAGLDRRAFSSSLRQGMTNSKGASMFKQFAIICAFSLALTVTDMSPALGQINPFDDSLNLNRADIDMIRQAAREDLDGKEVGSVVEWSNPETGNHGSVTLLRTFEYGGRDCREVQHLIDGSGGNFIQRYVNTICKQEDGSWRSNT